MFDLVLEPKVPIEIVIAIVFAINNYNVFTKSSDLKGTLPDYQNVHRR